MNSSPSTTPIDQVLGNRPTSPEAAVAQPSAEKVDKPAPTEPLRQNDVAWPVVQATAEAIAQAAGTTKPARKSAAKRAPSAAKRAASAKASAPGRRAVKTTALPAAKPAVKPAAKPPKKEHATSTAKPQAEPAPATKPARTKDKLVRDSFTMPRTDYALIDQLKQRGLGFKREVRKSELLRAGLQVLAAMDDTRLKAMLDKLPKIKTGRPRKAG